MAFADFFKKRKAEKHSEPQIAEASRPTVIVAAAKPETNSLLAPDTAPKEPIIPVQAAQQNTYQLTFVDAGTGRSLTDTFDKFMSLRVILDRMEEEGILSIPSLYARVKGAREWSIPISDGCIPAVRDIPDVHSGMTLTVDIWSVLPVRLQYLLKNPDIASRFRKEYPLVFFRKEAGSYTERIDMVCYGFEDNADVIYRILLEKRVRTSSIYSIPHWPKGQYLCQFDPPAGRVFVIEERIIPKNDNFDRMPVLYGCPTADLPWQMAALAHRHVDVICYE